MDGKIWSIIKVFYISCDVSIEDYKNNGSWSEILIKLISTTKYNTKLKGWDIKCIIQVEKIYDQISRGIQL